MVFNPFFHYRYKDLPLLESKLEVKLEGDCETAITLGYLARRYK